ncbi:MAG: hypothetical protein A2X94_10190 [Bdellovibrionales bacterium GWB1_55_8]|nr:MAG: hypothetical protein A2X94_10190 [Bdellovibrionales bacterium GWB1_55_8]
MAITGLASAAEITSAQTAAPARHLGITPKVGLSWLTYKEGSATDFAAIGLKTGIAGWHRIGTGTLIQLNGSVTALPVNDTGLAVPVRFAAMDGTWITDLGATDNSPSHWRTQLGLGAYYKRMFVSGNKFGYTDVNGPLALVNFEKHFSAGSSGRMEFRISPVLDGLIPLAPSSRELGFTVEWKKPLVDGRSLGVMAEWSELRIRIENSQVESNSLALGVIYGI